MDEFPSIAKDTSTRFHPEFDVDRWGERLQGFVHQQRRNLEALETESLNETIEAVDEYSKTISDGVERVRRRLSGRQDDIPTDVFVIDHLGEPFDRSVTRVGGVPYWPADRPWPTDWRGNALRFLAQINFRDSRDVVGDVPNDILVLFEGFWNSAEVWLPSGITNLIDPKDVPSQKNLYFSGHGVVARLFDPPATDERHLHSPFETIDETCVKVGGRPWARRSRSPRRGRFLFQIHGLSQHLGEAEEEIICCGDSSESVDMISLSGFTCCTPFTGFLMDDGSVRWGYNRLRDVWENLLLAAGMHPKYALGDAIED